MHNTKVKIVAAEQPPHLVRAKSERAPLGAPNLHSLCARTNEGNAARHHCQKNQHVDADKNRRGYKLRLLQRYSAARFWRDALRLTGGTICHTGLESALRTFLSLA